MRILAEKKSQNCMCLELLEEHTFKEGEGVREAWTRIPLLLKFSSLRFSKMVAVRIS